LPASCPLSERPSQAISFAPADSFMEFSRTWRPSPSTIRSVTSAGPPTGSVITTVCWEEVRVSFSAPGMAAARREEDAGPPHPSRMQASRLDRQEHAPPTTRHLREKEAHTVEAEGAALETGAIVYSRPTGHELSGSEVIPGPSSQSKPKRASIEKHITDCPNYAARGHVQVDRIR